MSEIIGRQIEFGVATEAVRGSAETAADKWIRKVAATILERAAHAEDDTKRGRLEDGEGRRKVQTYIEGELQGVLHADVLGWFLSNIYGVVVTSTVAGSVKSHLFTLAQNIQHPSLTLFGKDGSIQQRTYSNAMIDSLEISAQINELVRFRSKFIASVAASNSDTPSYDTEYDWVTRDITIKVADSEAGLGAASAVKAKDLTVTFTQGVIRDHVVGSYTPDDNYNTRLMIEGTITKNLEDTTFKDLYLGNSSKYMSIVLEGEADIGSGNHPSLTLVLNKVQVVDWTRTDGANELVTETITFRAYYNATDTEQSTATLKNLTASYDNIPSS